MQMQITKSAQEQLAQYLNDDQIKILLSFDDGVGPFSSVGMCSLDTAFQLVITKEQLATPDYDQVLKTNVGDVYYKGYSAPYLGDNLKLDFSPNFQNLVLSSEAEIIDSSVNVLDFAKA